MLSEIKTALLTVSSNVGHYKALKKTPPYIVWAEDGTNDPCAGDVHDDIVFTGTTDLFTNTENDPLVDQIGAAFEAAGICWQLYSVQHEDDTGLIHYEWTWEV